MYAYVLVAAGPIGPIGPTAPMWPSAPGAPSAPRAPGSPFVPFVPAAPVAPGAPSDASRPDRALRAPRPSIHATDQRVAQEGGQLHHAPTRAGVQQDEGPREAGGRGVSRRHEHGRRERQEKEDSPSMKTAHGATSFRIEDVVVDFGPASARSSPSGRSRRLSTGCPIAPSPRRKVQPTSAELIPRCKSARKGG
jgi:hypothetical protein